MRASKVACCLLLLLAAVGGQLGRAVGRRHHHHRKGPVFGCRIPRQFFVVQGFGETDEGSGMDPYETGAHDLAMEDAGIHEFNLVQYTSMLAPESQEISLEEAQQHPAWHHGAVLECIVSEVMGSRGDRITAGVGRMIVKGKGEDGEVVGGFATEYKGHAMEDVAEKQLEDALEELFERRFNPEDQEMEEKKYAITSKVVEKAFGTALAGVCFIDYIFPEIHEGKAGSQNEL